MPTKTVLIADDTSFVRQRFTTVLREAGHRALAAGTARELQDTLAAEGPTIDLVVADLRLPPSRGVEVVRAIRRTHADVPIVVFSGTIASAEEVRALAELGVAGYINEYSSPDHILPALAPHLFPDSFNRRSSARVPIGGPAVLRVGNTIFTAMTRDLSKGGVGIGTMNPLEAGVQLRVRFRLPDASSIEADSRVVWSDRRMGMGLQFERIEPADQLDIDDFVDRHCFTNRRA